jgi:hypothetical protein
VSKSHRITAIERAEIMRINGFLNDVQEGLFEGDEITTLQIQLTELHEVISTSRDKSFKAKDRPGLYSKTSNGDRVKTWWSGWC